MQAGRLQGAQAPRGRHHSHQPPLPGHEGDDRPHPRPRAQGRHLLLARAVDLRAPHRQLRTRGAGREDLRRLGLRLPQVRHVLLLDEGVRQGRLADHAPLSADGPRARAPAARHRLLALRIRT